MGTLRDEISELVPNIDANTVTIFEIATCPFCPAGFMFATTFAAHIPDCHKKWLDRNPITFENATTNRSEAGGC